MPFSVQSGCSSGLPMAEVMDRDSQQHFFVQKTGRSGKSFASNRHFSCLRIRIFYALTSRFEF
jgi:hypothetical protein